MHELQTVERTTLTLTPEAAEIMRDLAQSASDYCGYAVSGSGVVRALLAFAAGQKDAWLQGHIFSLVEQEMRHGTAWGRRRKGGE
jgi:hypothetical protein